MTAPKGTGRRPPGRQTRSTAATPKTAAATPKAPAAARKSPAGPPGKPPPPATAQPAARKPVPRQPAPAGSWWQNAWVIPAGVLSLAALLVIAIVAGRSTPSTSGLPNNAPRSPAPPSVAERITSLPARTFAAVGDGGVNQPLHLITGQKALTGADGRPLVLFVGADYCPFCAAERWSLVAALSRFGQLGGLQLTSSASNDTDPNTNTFDLSRVSFTSDVLDFQAVETSDRNGQPFQTLSPAQNDVYSALGNGTIPFVDFGNRYLASSAGYDPGDLQGLTWDQIATRLGDPNDSVTRAIVGNANRITAAVCAVTHDSPASVCRAAPIPQLEGQLPTS